MKRTYIVIWLLLLVAGPGRAQSRMPLYPQFGPELAGIEVKLPAVYGWVDGNHYLESRKGDGKMVFYAVDVQTGEATPYERKMGVLRPVVKVVNGDMMYISAEGKKQLTSTVAVEQNPALSPDGKWVAFTRENDLYGLEIATGREIRYTTDGSEVVMNGYASWVYYEEILGRGTNYRAFW